MTQQTKRAGIVSTGRRMRGAKSRTPSYMEPLEARLLLSHSAFVAALAVSVVTDHTDYVVSPIIGKSDQPSPLAFTPAQVRTAYSVDQTVFGSVAGDGTGQTIAIVDAYNAPTIQADLAAFDAQFGLPATSLTVINQNGGTNLPSTDPAGPGFSWAAETSLDVEWSHSIAPGANIVLVEASSSSNVDLNAAINEAKSYPGVSVVSMSFGGDETTADLKSNSLYTTPKGHIGVTFVASAGDFGAFGTGGIAKGVQYPAASPNVLGVGGTTLTTQADGTYISESAWGDGPLSGSIGGGGGGISRVETQPIYQKGVVTQSTTMRTVPDVSFLADPATGVAIIDSFDSPATPWMVVGGTSLAAPMWAGVMAIVNQGRTLAGDATMDGSTQTLPAIYALPSTDFNDITTGSNGLPAGPGYDLATGLGTPIVNLVVRDLVSSTTVPVVPVPIIGEFTATPASVTTGDSLTLTAGDVGESGGTVSSVVFYRESNSIDGLQPATDTFVGVGTQDGASWSVTTSTAGFAGGSYTYYAVATDTSGVSTTANTIVTVAASSAVNDSFANATVISGTVVNVTGTNVGASKEFKEPTIAKKAGGKSVWYSWTAPATGVVSINTTGSNFDTLLGVYKAKGTPTVSKLALVASNDDTSYAVLTSSTSFKAKAGTIYYIAVDGFNGAAGTINLNLNETVTAAAKKKKTPAVRVASVH